MIRNTLLLVAVLNVALAEKCSNGVVPSIANTAALTKDLSVQATGISGGKALWPNYCPTTFQLQDKTKSLAIKPSGLQALMTSVQSSLCVDGVSGIQFYDGTVKKIDYCVGKCAAGTTTTYADTEVTVKKPLVRVYTDCPTPFKPTVSYRVVP